MKSITIHDAKAARLLQYIAYRSDHAHNRQHAKQMRERAKVKCARGCQMRQPGRSEFCHQNLSFSTKWDLGHQRPSSTVTACTAGVYKSPGPAHRETCCDCAGTRTVEDGETTACASCVATVATCNGQAGAMGLVRVGVRRFASHHP